MGTFLTNPISWPTSQTFWIALRSLSEIAIGASEKVLNQVLKKSASTLVSFAAALKTSFWFSNVYSIEARNIRANLRTPMPASFIKYGVAGFGGFAEYYRGDARAAFADVADPALQARFKATSEAAGQAMADLADWLKAQPASPTPNFALGAERFARIIELLQAEKLVDSIGIQGHAFCTNEADTPTLRANLERLAVTGLPLFITELDVDGHEDADQLAEYQRLFPLFWDHPSVMGVTIWGYRPGMWRTAQGAILAHDNGAERPAFQWLLDYVRKSDARYQPVIRALPAQPAPAQPAPAAKR